MWEPRRLTTLWAFKACYRKSFTFLPSSILDFMKIHLAVFEFFHEYGRMKELGKLNRRSCWIANALKINAKLHR
jgi:hypothetical protein